MTASALKLLQSCTHETASDAMNLYYQTIKSPKQQLDFSCRSSWLSGAGLMFKFRFAFSFMGWGLCIIYASIYTLCLNNVKHQFSAELDWDKKPEVTSEEVVVRQIELNGCWPKSLMDGWWFSLSHPSFIAESGMSYQNTIPVVSLTSSLGFPWLLWPNIVYFMVILGKGEPCRYFH